MGGERQSRGERGKAGMRAAATSVTASFAIKKTLRTVTMFAVTTMSAIC